MATLLFTAAAANLAAGNVLAALVFSVAGTVVAFARRPRN